MSIARRRLLATLALALLFQVAGWVPAARGSGTPPTVGTDMAVPLAPLVRGVAPGAAMLDDGSLRATTTVWTGAESLCAPFWFTAVALVWEQSDGAPVRARLATGPDVSGLGRGRILAPEPAEAPDPRTPEYHGDRQGTELLWTGGSRCVRLSLRLPAGSALSDLRAAFVNTSGTAAGPGTGPRDLAPLASAGGGGLLGGLFAPQGAGALTVRPAMVPRWKWGADPAYFNTGTPGCSAPYYAPAVKMAFVHHTSGVNAYAPSQSDDIVRSIYWYHTQERGYCDIAYNFLIDRYGTIFVGRKGGVTRPVIPGSQMGFNTGTFSVSLMGNFQDAPPPAAAVDSLEQLLAWRLDVAHLPAKGTAVMVSAGGSTTKYPRGTRVRLPIISGHRDTGITDCPGDFLYVQLPDVRSVVRATGLPKIYRPTASAEHVTPGLDTVTFTARGSESLTWRVDVMAADGSVLASMSSVGTLLAQTWDGTDASGLPVPPGTYSVVLAAQSADGGEALPATLPIAVNPLPSPSPSPTPTASPTASPSTSPTAGPTGPT